MNRNKFFKTAGRLLMLGGITASASYLVINKKVSVDCSVSSSCKSCQIYAKCTNPEVKKARDGR